MLFSLSPQLSAGFTFVKLRNSRSFFTATIHTLFLAAFFVNF
jgi:hypothetical protein